MRHLKPVQLICLILFLGFSIPFLAGAQNTNVAQGKAATQSSNYTSTAGLAGKAVDGNTNGQWAGGSVTHTNGNGEKNPWWMVNLGQVYDVSEIQLWNRTDCCKDRLSNLRIYVKEKESDTWAQFNSGYHQYNAAEVYPLSFKANRKAQFVLVQLTTDRGILSLAEVKVMGKPASTDIVVSYRPATIVGSPSDCGTGTFKDVIDGGTCWTCPSGYNRTVFSVKSDKACERAGGELFKPAIRGGRGGGLLGTDCSGGQFWDPNGYCYSCPQGYSRTAYPVTSGQACSQRVPAGYTYATKVGSYGRCNDGFYDLGTNKCWTCPSGYTRTLLPLNGGQACEKITVTNN